YAESFPMFSSLSQVIKTVYVQDPASIALRHLLDWTDHLRTLPNLTSQISVDHVLRYNFRPSLSWPRHIQFLVPVFPTLLYPSFLPVVYNPAPTVQVLSFLHRRLIDYDSS